MQKGKSRVCNCCGRNMESEQGKEDFLHVEKEWGYFSDKDGVRQTFDLCEICYDKWIKTFRIPVLEEEMMELL